MVSSHGLQQNAHNSLDVLADTVIYLKIVEDLRVVVLVYKVQGELV